jgi:hypothetical protein
MRAIAFHSDGGIDLGTSAAIRYDELAFWIDDPNRQSQQGVEYAPNSIHRFATYGTHPAGVAALRGRARGAATR